MNAIELLTAQHAKAKVLLAQLLLASREEKRELFEELSDELALHAALEERHFYPATRLARSEDSLQQAEVEHFSMKQIVAGLLDREPEDERFDAGIALLQELMERHIREEEDELFRAVERMLSAEELEELGLSMEEELEAPRAAAETGAGAPLE